MSTEIKTPIKIMHLNSQSLKGKIERILSYMTEYGIHIASINETWLTKEIKLKTNNFNLVRKDRENKSRGGVCLLIDSRISYETIDFSPLPDEAVGISITSRNNKNTTINEWNLVSLYNPPNTQLNPSFFNFINQLKGNVLLMGHLNSHHRNWFCKTNDSNGNFLIDFVQKHDWTVHNNDQKTFTPIHRMDSHSVID